MVQEIHCNSHTSYLLSILRRKLRHICSRLRWCLVWRRPRSKVIIKRFGKSNSKLRANREPSSKKSTILGYSNSKIPIRVATFNVAMFSLSPAISKDEELALFNHEKEDYVALRRPVEIKNQAKAANYSHKSILKQSPLHTDLSSPEHLSKQKKGKKHSCLACVVCSRIGNETKRKKAFNQDAVVSLTLLCYL